MAAIVFPFVMELLVVVLFAVVAFPVWIATKLLDSLISSELYGLYDLSDLYGLLDEARR